jgi:hypothetical protein
MIRLNCLVVTVAIRGGNRACAARCARVWQAVQEDLPALRAALDRLLAEPQ